MTITDRTHPYKVLDKARALAEFHKAVGHPDTDSLWLRPTLHDEEHAELIEALHDLCETLKQAAWSDDSTRVSLKAVARELADVLYIAYGTAHVAGIDLDAAFAEVHRANMHKARAGIRREDGKIVKPPDFVPPDMAEAVAFAAYRPTEGRSDGD